MEIAGLAGIQRSRLCHTVNTNRKETMTDKVKLIIWVFDTEDNKKKQINLQTLLNRANSSTCVGRFKYFALEKDRNNFAKERKQ